MSYESIKLAQTPLLYYRLDQGGFGVNGESVPDIGTGGFDAELVFTGDQPAWGHVSPIETDSPSREFWHWTNAALAFSFNGVSRITRASDASMAPSPKDFTVGEWLRPMDNIPAAGIFTMADKQGTGGVMMTLSGGTRFGGYCFDSAGTLFTVIDPSILVTDHLGESSYIVVGRSGDALFIYRDGVLRNFTTVTSGLPTQFTSQPFRIGPDTGFYTNARHDEVEYHTRALSAAEIAESDEAARNALNMRGECNIRTTAVLSGADEPDPAAYSFRHNWSEPVIERFRARTGIFKPTDGPVELRRQRSQLRRQVEYQHLLFTEKLRRQFEARAFGGRTTLVQFEPDKVRIPTLAASLTSAAFDTTLRDFQVGQYVLIFQDDDNYEFQLLTTVTDDGIEWETTLSQEYVKPFLKPARVARIPSTQEIELHTDVVGESSTIYDYLEEDEPLSPRRITPFTPTLTYHSREVFDIREWQGHDYSELPVIEYVADRSELDDGTGVVSVKQYRWGAETTQPYNMNLDGRELIAKYLGWLYYRAGQYQPFWMPTFVQNLKPLSRAGVELTVEGHEYSNYYTSADNRMDLAFIYFDNTMLLRRIESAIPSGTNDILTLDSTVPTFTNLRWLSFLRRVVLSSDDVEIAWHTDDTVRIAFAVVDAPIDIALGSPSVSPSPSASISTSTSPSASGSRSPSPSSSASPSSSLSPSSSQSQTPSPSSSLSPSSSQSPSSSVSPSISPSASLSPSPSASPST